MSTSTAPTRTPGMGVSLDKITGMGTGTETLTAPPTPKITRTPYYPLVGHRAGLRANDMVTLASALWILCNEEGRLHS